MVNSLCVMVGQVLCAFETKLADQHSMLPTVNFAIFKTFVSFCYKVDRYPSESQGS